MPQPAPKLTLHGPCLACRPTRNSYGPPCTCFIHSGDCFYMAVENALSESEGWQPWYAVAAMREVVASHLTEEIFQMYTLLHAQRAEGERLLVRR